MSIAAAHSAAFYSEVAAERIIWTIRDEGGFPAPVGSGGRRAMPFWSTESRASKVVESVPAYCGFKPVSIPWDEFESRWIPGLAKDGLLVGVNWSGSTASGYDVEPSQVKVNVEALIPVRR